MRAKNIVAKLLTGALIAALVALVAVGEHAMAGGKKADGKGPNKIYMSGKTIPLKVFQKHDGKVLMSWFAANKSNEIWEDVETKTWEFWILIVFAKPSSELEYDISFYDTEVFPKHLVNSFTLMLMKKGEKIIPHKIRIDEKNGFKANHQYLMQLTAKGVIKAERTFNLRGKQVVYDGKVTFTDKETKEN